jgi:hypothetical protein
VQAATGARDLTDAELQTVLEHVARAGFSPFVHVAATGLVGMLWQGHLLRGRDRITSAERHYLRHVVQREEWPPGTSLADYVGSAQAVVLDPTSGVFTNRYQGFWQLGVVRDSGSLKGPAGGAVVLVQYRVALNHWTTVHQLRRGLVDLALSAMQDERWLRPMKPLG